MPDTEHLPVEDQIAALRTAIFQTHGCLESHRKETQASFTEVNKQIGAIQASVDIGNGYSAQLLKRLNVDPAAEDVKAAPGAWSLKKMAVVGFSCLSGVVLALQLLIPPAQAAAVAFYHALMNAH